MYVLNFTDDLDSFINCTDNENEDIIFIIIKYLLLSIPAIMLLFSVIDLVIDNND